MRPKIRIKDTIDRLASHSGLIHVGTLLEATDLKQRLDQFDGVRFEQRQFSHSDVLFSMIGLISIGKPDYEAIELFRPKAEFFNLALGLSGCPSAVTLRQRIDLLGQSVEPILVEESAKLVKAKAPALTPIQTSCGPFLPLDIDVSPFDNSKTQKEGVSRTYKGCDGYAPIFGYLGAEGYLVNLELRDGSQHCQNGTPGFIEESIRYTRQFTSAPVLLRLDSGNDSRDNFPDIERDDVNFIIKRNLRRESPLVWFDLAKRCGEKNPSREGKEVWVGQTLTGINGQPLPYPIVFKVTSRSITKKGQKLAFPEIDVETYWCSLAQMPALEVIDLYHDHGTSEQYHSELKSDLDIERLPSGHFASNSLVLHLAMLSYNILRIIGQHSLEEARREGINLPGSRSSKYVQRRRIRTVIQDLMYMAGRLVYRGRQWYIGFGRLNPFARLWGLIDYRLRGANA
jgi:hypothetical protein